MGLTLTKSELRDRLGCTTWQRFYAKFMTEHVITTVLKLSKPDYSRLREFDVEQTRRLKEYFQLT